MIGRWMADSTYDSEDTRALGLGGLGVMLEILADTSFTQVDTSGRAFPRGKSEGVYYLHGDTLIIFPLAAPPDTFTVHLRFLGNYLELLRASDQRYTFFHKIRPRDSILTDSLLGDSLWRMMGRRLDPGINFTEAGTRDFSYLRFSGDSIYSDSRVNGVIRVDSGKVIKKDTLWTWKATGGERAFLADLVQVDTLRLWPLAEGRPDSGYYIYKRNFRHHEYDIDMRRLIGRLRSDSLSFDNPFTPIFDYHFGRFYDWILGDDHKVMVESNMAGVPMWTSWTLDSGYLALSAPGKGTLRMRVDTAMGRVKLTPDSSALFPVGSFIHQTLVDGTRFAAQPLERFSQASYLHIVIAGDTTAFYFDANNNKERFEISNGAGKWAVFLLGKTQETFQSSQPDFYLAYEAGTPKLGNFTCRSRPYKDLVIRQTVSADPLMAAGLIQGTCEIQRADSAFSDSTMEMTGAFRIKRKSSGPSLSTIWSLP